MWEAGARSFRVPVGLGLPGSRIRSALPLPFSSRKRGGMREGEVSGIVRWIAGLLLAAASLRLPADVAASQTY